MTLVRIHVNPLAIREVLKGEGARRAVRDAAERIAQQVDAQGLQAQSGWAAMGIGPEIVADVADETTDRARAVVAVKHPAASAMEAKHGVLSKAASAAGYELHGG